MRLTTVQGIDYDTAYVSSVWPMGSPECCWGSASTRFSVWCRWFKQPCLGLFATKSHRLFYDVLDVFAVDVFSKSDNKLTQWVEVEVLVFLSSHGFCV